MPLKKDKAKPKGAAPDQAARQESLLRQGIQELGLHIEERSESLLITYVSLLLQQNQTINLTAIIDPMEAVTKHLLDSLSIAQDIPDGIVVDVGSGGGCPGIPLAIIKPENQFVLVEPKNKKADFLKTTTQALGLNNTKTICQRAESVEL